MKNVLRVPTPRQRRVLAALAATDGWISREEVDRIAGASNGPQIIAELRHRWGISIEMEQARVVDRDNRPCKPGRYRLKPEGRERLTELGDFHG